jgi:type VI secretion system secreted protein VgrG
MESDNEFFSFLGQMKDLVTTNRPLRLRLDTPGGVNDDMLLPQRVHGSEALCGGFEYRMLCVSARVDLPLKEMIALPATLEFVTDTGDIRSVCGIITEAASGDSDGGLASYQLVLRDAFAILEKRINTRVFRHLNELEIVQRLLSEWRQRNPPLGTSFLCEVDPILARAEYPQREFTMQFNESDAHFMRRLLKRRGISWVFRPDPNGAYPVHTLLLFNDAQGLRRNAAGTIRYHRDNATEQRDTITSWSAVRSLQPGSVGRHSWDYRNSLGTQFMSSAAQGASRQGVSGNALAASLDDYRILAPHAGADCEDLCRLGQLRMSRYDYESKCFHGEGSVRDLCAGEYFTLNGHAEVDQHPATEREFVVTSLQLTAHNNLPKALAARVERLFARNRWMRQGVGEQEVSEQVASGALRMHVQFTAVRRGIEIVPDYDERSELPQVPMQSAVVVGPPNEEVHCDQMGRVKIRFPGTRPEDHQQAAGSGASDSEIDSAWVRVASNWAGNGPGSMGQCGTVGLPRIGTEVLVAFLGGDPDKPVIVGQMYNQQAQPPALSNLADLPGNRYLSGMKSRELQGGRANQLRFDDTQGQISAQLASDHGDTQLNLGFLTQPKVDGYGEPRGEGAELTSDEAVAIRASNGILLSAQANPGGAHLAREELIGIADVLNSISAQLASLAQTHTSDDATESQLSQLIEGIRNWDSGMKRAVIAVSAPEGMLLASQRNVAIGAQNKLDLMCAGDAEVSSGRNIFVRAVRGISIFAHALGMKLIAASGNVAIQSHNGDINLTATGRIRISAGQGIELQAPEIKLASKGAQTNYGGGAVTHQCKSDYIIKSANFSHTTGGGGEISEIKFPSTKIQTDERVILYYSQSGEPVKGRRYKLTLPDGSTVEGTTDDQGRTDLATSDEFGDIQILIYPADPKHD